MSHKGGLTFVSVRDAKNCPSVTTIVGPLLYV